MSIPHVHRTFHPLNQYIFDVDGTLSPSRGEMDPEFLWWFSNFIDENTVYLVTGSDKPKTVEQITDYVYNRCVKVYQCSGAEVYHRDDVIYKSDWLAPQSLHDALNIELQNNKFPLRTGNHIEQRTGLLNYSVVGRNCTLGERKLYVEYDIENNDREQAAERLRKDFPDIEFKVAGETGIDITPRGGDKSQILRDFNDNGHIYFFGDKTSKGGNDYEIYEAVKGLPNGKAFTVMGWKDTWNILKTL